MVLLDRLEQVVGRVVDAGQDLGVALGVGGPDDDDLVEAVLALELADVGTDLVDVRRLGLTGEGVVGTLLLVLGDKVGVVTEARASSRPCKERPGAGGRSPRTLARVMAWSMGRPEMSQPPRTRSLGWTMGRTLEKGTQTSLPVAGSVPRRMVEARTSEP